MSSTKRLFWSGFALAITGFLYYKFNYASTFPAFLPKSPWLGGFTNFFKLNPDFAQDIFKTYLGLGTGAVFVVFLLALWGLKK